MCKIERINPAVSFSWEFCENGNDNVHKYSLGTRNYYIDGETADSLTFKVSSHFRALDPYLELICLFHIKIYQSVSSLHAKGKPKYLYPNFTFKSKLKLHSASSLLSCYS